jgi:hypothetical protein
MLKKEHKETKNKRYQIPKAPREQYPKANGTDGVATK